MMQLQTIFIQLACGTWISTKSICTTAARPKRDALRPRLGGGTSRCGNTHTETLVRVSAIDSQCKLT